MSVVAIPFVYDAIVGVECKFVRIPSLVVWCLGVYSSTIDFVSLRVGHILDHKWFLVDAMLPLILPWAIPSNWYDCIVQNQIVYQFWVMYYIQMYPSRVWPWLFDPCPSCFDRWQW